MRILLVEGDRKAAQNLENGLEEEGFVVDVAGSEIVSAITRRSAEELGLAEGDSVTVVITSTEVMLARD